MITSITGRILNEGFGSADPRSEPRNRIGQSYKYGRPLLGDGSFLHTRKKITF